MNKLFNLSILSIALLSACATKHEIDITKVDEQCSQKCQNENAECRLRFAEFPTLAYAHCKGETENCLHACPTTKTVATPTKSTAAHKIESNPSITERLKLLEELHQSGLISDQEYADKRIEILKQL